jgi:hypothetical protein
MKDASGHEHVGKGSPQGGQFGKGGGGASSTAEKVHQGHEVRPTYELGEAVKPNEVNSSREPEFKRESASKESNRKSFTIIGMGVTKEQEQEMHDWQKQHYGRWNSSIGSEGRRAIGEYATQEYEAMNRSLRNPEFGKSFVFEEEHPNAKAAVPKAIDAINKARAPERFVAYRGIKNIERTLGKDVKIGDVFREAAFMSMSQDYRVASGFHESRGDVESGAMLQITIPKGSRVAGIDSDALSVSGSNHEVVASPGHRLKITGIEKHGSRTYISARLLPPKK